MKHQPRKYHCLEMNRLPAGFRITSTARLISELQLNVYRQHSGKSVRESSEKQRYQVRHMPDKKTCYLGDSESLLLLRKQVMFAEFVAWTDKLVERLNEAGILSRDIYDDIQVSRWCTVVIIIIIMGWLL